VEDIVAASDISAGDVVLEVGPGKGTLTRALLSAGATVIAIEKDRELVAHLKELFSGEIASGRLILAEGDILTTDISRFLEASGANEAMSYKLVSNIPYYITGEILRKFLSEPPAPARMVLLIQKEVAERIAAKDGKESILSLSVKLYGAPRIVRRVPRKFFSPPPAVDSAVLSVTDIARPSLSAAEERRFFELVKRGFSQKRKQLVPLLSERLAKERLLGALAAFGLPANARAEDLPLSAWLSLAKG
jgi:16S rRNA (adenine1518-N6/adenine1519-N6)-dimethyltransferase